jgi:hypothetical protein
VKADRELFGVVEFDLVEVMGRKVSKAMETSVVMRAFQSDMKNFCVMLEKFYKTKKILAKVKGEIVNGNKT